MKIVVVDDHPLIVEALHHVLKSLAEEVEVFDARTAAEGRARLEAHPDADLLLLDLGLPGTDGFSLLADIRESFPTVPVVVLSGTDSRDDVVRAIDAGAMGFIPKSSSNQVMVNALRIVLTGTPYIPPEVLRHQEAAAAGASGAPGPRSPGWRDLGLTERQTQVLALMLQGKPNKLICRELNLAEGTVKIHVAAILRALNVANRTQAVIEASRLGLELPGLADPGVKG
ncbi:MAG: response regulator transcription factor [Burkholderiales bacterium]|nr:response regulator transcription factor [Burkholderiales bacterium]